MSVKESSDFKRVLGIDIGSVSAGMVVMTTDRKVISRHYRFHQGDISTVIFEMMEEIDMNRICAVAATDQTPLSVYSDFRCDDRVAVIAAARHFNETVGSILQVGGETFSMMYFYENGDYAGLKTNTSCAAGTGSFLDQQASRLKLSGIAELAELAEKNTGTPPKIASRCAVFAKTDLIHAQQEGYTLSEICDGLCLGLARNIVNTLFKHDKCHTPLIFCGGVSKNRAVIDHISVILGEKPVTDDMAHLYGAFGAGARMIDELGPHFELPAKTWHMLRATDAMREYGHPPLQLVQSCYPDFDSQSAYLYSPRIDGAQNRLGPTNQVEVDIYEAFEPHGRCSFYIGIDIGSISTKAVWMSPEKKVLAGFYTRTAGRPVEAMRSLLEAMDDLVGRRAIEPDVRGVGTTGSGRKFVGAILGADVVVDEITAHARAAFELNPDVDTIIEIGGQDAKFTTLKKGRVTFSIMNTVCAAGTGSFIEEQAEKMGVPLFEYAGRTEGVASPIASDRCTVFMERDINYYLSCGYSVNEVLAAGLHAVCENYLNKVARESSIGSVVCFQGATAKNRALVAAFEQRLNRSIYVSPYCHLTGALGAALLLSEQSLAQSRFRGLDMYKAAIPVRTEVCDLCANHCKITVADMPDGPAAYGFLCGRDYETRRYVNNNLSGFDLVRSYRKVFSSKKKAPSQYQTDRDTTMIVGIPSALYMFEDVSMWVDFFDRLGIQTIVSDTSDAVKSGKELAFAEFCAPMAAMHGHVAHLADKVDYIFLPYYLESGKSESGGRRQYCYYSQYVPALVADMDKKIAGKLISPIKKYLYSSFYLSLEIYRAIRKIDDRLSFIEIVKAFEQSRNSRQKAVKQWQETFNTHFSKAGDIAVVLLGRPYTVFDPAMNKNIPRIFSAMGIKAFSHDMIDCGSEKSSSIRPFLKELHWQYAAGIMTAAETVSKTPGLYPVLLTSFNCSPDSFIRDVFQSLMEAADKPYLILEMDEHGSSVGYETRIEAAIRSFHNHNEVNFPHAENVARINPVKAESMKGKIVVLPNWDPITCRLLAANLKREGIDVRLMTENEGVIRRSMRLNSGQCIPINVVAQEFVEHVRDNDIDPEEAVLWMVHAEIACNIRLYPYKLRQMIGSFGGGMERAGVYAGAIGFTDVSFKAGINTYFAYMFGGMLRKMGCRIRPYEKNKGETDQVLESSIMILEDAFLGRCSRKSAVAEVVDRFLQIRTNPGRRIEVAIFGDLYARDNPVFNQDLIAFIEAHGGEAITTPYTDYVKMIAPSYYRKWFIEGKYYSLLVNRSVMAAMVRHEKSYSRQFQKVLKTPEPVYDVPHARILSEFNVIPEHTGESMDNLLKIYYIKKYHPNVSLFVQASPSFCCPSLVTEAMAKNIESRVGVPVVCITYDGTGGDKNRKIIPYLEFATDRATHGKMVVEGG